MYIVSMVGTPNTFRKADLHAPRYRPKVMGILNREFLAKFRTKYPQYKDVSDEDLKRVIRTLHKNIRTAVIDNRNGVELMNSMGILFVGSCKSSSSKNIDYSRSATHDVPVAHRNWNTDGFVCKIFYTNFAVKYKVKNRELWAFDPCKDFSKETSKTYRENHTRYMVVNNKVRISNILLQRKQAAIERRNNAPLGNYDEFQM
jgi:hypothetical protein